jgi:cytidylate kinase
MIVTIDGPAGSGKSTAARGLAGRLGFEFLDTGAMYRAVALALHRLEIDVASEQARAILQTLRLEMSPGRIVLNGEDVSTLIRTPEMAAASSKVAVVTAVRTYLVELQRTIAAGRSMVCEGRDQGTIVFPDAPCKFFLTASPMSRALRRQADMLGRGRSVPIEDVLAEQDERDRRDAGRDVGPMRPAPDAIVLDTSDLTAEQVLDRLEHEVRRCAPG